MKGMLITKVDKPTYMFFIERTVLVITLRLLQSFHHTLGEYTREIGTSDAKGTSTSLAYADTTLGKMVNETEMLKEKCTQLDSTCSWPTPL